MTETIKTLRYTRTTPNGEKQTAVVDIVVGAYGRPVVLVEPALIDEILEMGGYTKETP